MNPHLHFVRMLESVMRENPECTCGVAGAHTCKRCAGVLECVGKHSCPTCGKAIATHGSFCGQCARQLEAEHHAPEPFTPTRPGFETGGGGEDG